MLAIEEDIGGSGRLCGIHLVPKTLAEVIPFNGASRWLSLALSRLPIRDMLSQQFRRQVLGTARKYQCLNNL